MRDWPEPDQDTALDILETWDPSDYEEMRAERAEIEFYKATIEEPDVQLEDDPYADWTPNSSHCSACSEDMYYDDLCAESETEKAEYDKHQEDLEKLRRETRITKIHTNMAQAKADIIQAEANIARITVDIAAVKSEIAKANYDKTNACTPYSEDPEGHYDACNWLASAEINLTHAETNLGEAEAILSKAKTIGVTYAGVIIAQNDLKNAEVMVQAEKDAKDIAIEIRVISDRKYHIEESNLLDEGAHIEFTRPFSEQQQDIIEIGFCPEWVHIKYVNALMDLAEAQDALDLAETHLVKTPLLCISRSYGFASNEPRCPFESSLTKCNKVGQE
jgi:hypothetical protein